MEELKQVFGEIVEGFGYLIEVGADFVDSPVRATNKHIAQPIQQWGRSMQNNEKSEDSDSAWSVTDETDPVPAEKQPRVGQVRSTLDNYRKVLVMRRDYDKDEDTYDVFTLIAHRNELAKLIREEYPTVTRHSSLDSFATAMRESNIEFTADQIIALMCYYRTI